jgi:Xaa-Pro aminopeptidase
MVKSDDEIATLRRACVATDAAVAAALARVGVGITERQLSRWIDDALTDLADGPGFDTIVASGPNGSIPHHRPTDRGVEAGDFVTIDCGALIDGYHADWTRTVLVGAHDPADWQSEIYDVVRSAQQAGIAALSPGAPAAAVDAAARSVVNEAGFGDYFVHGLGHGVGLQIHEAPYLGASSVDRIALGVPVTVEPGIYLPGRGGVRIEDTVVVRADHVESLTTTSRDLLVVG